MKNAAVSTGNACFVTVGNVLGRNTIFACIYYGIAALNKIF
jgi:hypothetical protein